MNAENKYDLFKHMVHGCGQFGFGTFVSVCSLFGVYNIYRDYINAVEKRTRMNGISKMIQVGTRHEDYPRSMDLECYFKVSDIEDEKTLAFD